MLPDELKQLEEKEPPISKECYTLYHSTDKTLKQIATLKNIKYTTLKYYSKTYKYKKRMEHYNIIKPSKDEQHNKEKSNTTRRKQKKKTKKYQIYTYEHTTKLILALTDKELKQLKNKSKKESYICLEDYLLTVLKTNYEYIEANKILGYPEHLKELDNSEDIIKQDELLTPKLIRCKNNITDLKQTVLEDYY